MSESEVKPQVVSEGDVTMVGPGHDDSHYISVPIKQFFVLERVGDVGISIMQPGDETCVFGIEEEDDGTAPHHYGPCDEFYYILYGEFTVWWGKDAANLTEFYELKEGDCAYYPTGWKYKVKNTGSVPGKFFYYMSAPRSGTQRLDKVK
jgi:mannose-6-phosphate isomerase-like protein (cupin superfamily)